jgi:hypothetical protein
MFARIAQIVVLGVALTMVGGGGLAAADTGLANQAPTTATAPTTPPTPSASPAGEHAHCC